VAIAPPAWEQRPRLITLFTANPGMGGEKAVTIYTTLSTILSSTPLDSQNNNRYARVSWGSALSIPQQPPQLRPDPTSTTVGQQRNDARTSTTGNRTSSTAPRMSHRPIINITMMPQGWPARTEACHHSSAHSACPTFFSKAPPRVLL
jgi:hypothetical protein